jgi:hypothetical protein
MEELCFVLFYDNKQIKTIFRLYCPLYIELTVTTSRSSGVIGLLQFVVCF